MKRELIADLWICVLAMGALLVFYAVVGVLKGYPLHLTLLSSGIAMAAIGMVGIVRMHPKKTDGS